MCGIAGFVGNGSGKELEAMSREIAHRGPDDSGLYLGNGIGLAFRRLSIIDLSPAGHQPMWSKDKSIAIIFNGEIYNYRELREQLEKRGTSFVSHSDTEVILELYQTKGEDCFAELSGMFAIALYDFQKQKLVLARDRMGEKPLYWSRQNGTLSFASEMRALISSGFVSKQINHRALEKYLLFDYVPTPSSMLAGVEKLAPASYLVYENDTVRTVSFWKAPLLSPEVAEADVIAGLDTRLDESVASQLVSDVPLGVFLSGGIDSSTVAWYAQKHASVKMDTFSIGFDSADFDESSYARSVASHLGTNHHERMVTANDALKAVHAVPEVFSEPVADASVLPTILLSEFAKKNVTVALGGDGADELFAGYPTFGADAVARLYQAVPRPMREMVRKAVSALPADESYFGAIFNAKKFTGSDEADTEFRHMEWLGSFSREGRESLLGSAGNSAFDDVVRYRNEFPQNDALNRLLYVYARTYLMDGVLVKVDRASMHYGLEVRAPFLSKEIVEYAFSLPSHLKYRNGTSKYLLKKIMQGRLPDGILQRKKKGFGIPLARWLKHELKPLCTDLLSPSELGKHGLLNPAYVNQLMTEHFEGRQDNRKQLWNLMVFQMWYNRWIG